MIPQSFVQELLARVDIADVIGRHVQLRKRGANLIGLCPFHGEKTPSFTVSPTKQFYHCFGCGVSGNAISFYIQFLGVSFPEAVRTLAQEVGVQVPQSPKSAAERRRDQEQQKLRTLHEHLVHQAQLFYQEQLRHHLPAIKYLQQRGLQPETIEHFGLGWAPNDWQGLARVFDNYQAPELLETGLVAQGKEGRRYDRFRGRVIFPIRNIRGHTIGFGGRLIAAGEPKYLNSPETALFSKSHELYGIYEARQAIHRAGYALVVEGYMDVVALAQLGLDNAVATLGTATTAHHLQRLTRLTNKIVFCFDADRAGQQAAWRALEQALPHVRDDLALHFMFLPEGYDPDSYGREFGLSAFKEQVAQAPVFSQFFLQEWAQRHDLSLVEGRSACVHEALPYLAQLPDNNFSRQLLQAFAQQARLTFDELLQQLSQWHSRNQPQTTVATGSFEGTASAARAPRRTERKRAGDTPQTALPGSPERGGRAAATGPARPTGLGRQVTPLAQRLLQLLLMHPELSDKITAEQLEIVVQSPHLIYVQELIALINDTGCAHSGAVLEVVDPRSELAAQLKGMAQQLPEQELPDPLSEWQDALRRIEIDHIKTEQLTLIEGGLTGADVRQRYQLLTRRLAELTAAPGAPGN